MKLALIGSGQFARELYHLVKSDGKYKEICFVDIYRIEGQEQFVESDFFDLPVEDFRIMIAMGEPSMRKKMYIKYKEKGYAFATYIHGSSILQSSVDIKEGSIIFPFCYIATGVTIGENTLLHTGVRIENDCKLGNHNFISSGVFVGAKTTIENEVFAGPNSAITDNLIIQDRAVIGIGSCVIKDVKKDYVVVGNPAHKIRINTNRMILNH